MPIAVVTFDEPEFEPSYAGTRNEGRSAFAWLFFTGRCRMSDLRLSMLRQGLLRGAVHLVCGVAYAIRTRFGRVRTIFDVLAEEGIRATFFGVFELIDGAQSRARYLPVFKAILAHGHELGLHGYRHGPLTEADLDRSMALAREHLGVELRTYSSPFGDDRPETLELVERRGFVGMRVWDRGLLDRTTKLKLFAYHHELEKAVRSGQPVVVLNLHSGDCYPWGLARVERAIATLKSQGYCFTTFEALCGSSNG